ncbi:MAG: hypothetical protein C4534_06495 [Gaiellales bacterium]|nr:MAG: hypothetical protein C4534_06495 [Gaiellales bacterium]
MSEGLDCYGEEDPGIEEILVSGLHAVGRAVAVDDIAVTVVADRAARVNVVDEESDGFSVLDHGLVRVNGDFERRRGRRVDGYLDNVALHCTTSLTFDHGEGVIDYTLTLLIEVDVLRVHVVRRSVAVDQIAGTVLIYRAALNVRPKADRLAAVDGDSGRTTGAADTELDGYVAPRRWGRRRWRRGFSTCAKLRRGRIAGIRGTDGRLVRSEGRPVAGVFSP